VAGFAAFGAAILISPIDGRLAAVPLSLFLSLCAAAPFLPRFGFFLPVVSKGISGDRAVALTFDDGPDPLSTPPLLQLLERHHVKAAFFVTGKKASQHPGLIKEILSHGHEVGNHSYSHDNFIMLKGSKALKKEIQATQDVLQRLGITPLAFRPPVGITNPRLWRIMRELGMYTVNFSCRARDVGNRRIRRLSRKILKRVCPGDIIALHDRWPGNDGRFSYWLHDIELILSGIREKGLAVFSLSQFIDKPVMLCQNEKNARDQD